MDKKHKEMDALLMNGERAKITIEIVHGQYAVHPRISGGRAIGDGWTVSHLLSGMALWTVAGKDDAMKIAEWLETYGGVPAEPDRVLGWKDGMTVREQGELINKLTAIAPRYFSPWRTT